MNNKALLAALLLAGLAISTPVFGWAIKVSPGGGAVWAMGEEIEESDFGYNFSGSVEVEVWKGFDYGFKYFYSNAPTVFTDSMLFDTSITTVDADFRHHAFLLTNSWSPGWRWVDPYVRGSAGIYAWRQLDGDDPFSITSYQIDGEDTLIQETEFKGTSFGVGIGGGVRIWPTDWLGFRLGVDYDLVFSEDRDKFGSQDCNENLLRAGGEVVFRIPIK